MKKIFALFTIITIISCSSKEVTIEEISFLFDNNNAQPNLVSNDGALSLSWISSNDEDNTSLHISQFIDEKWTKPQTIAKGSNWFVNWADFPAHAINGDLILTNYLKKSDSGTYTYDVVLSLHKLTGEKIKEDFILHSDGIKAEHGFVSIISNENQGFYITRRINDVWESPRPVHNDGWIINGCPVNGPKVAVNSNNFAVSWFTVSNGKPTVNLSFSKSNGNSFGSPLKINDHNAIGRVDVAFLNDQEVIVSYIEVDDIGTYLRIKKVSIDGTISAPITISKIDGGRNTGVPQLEIFNNEIFIVWTVLINEKNQLKSVKLNSENI